MKIPPAATAVTVGMITSRTSRDRTRQFFSARRAERCAGWAPGCWPPPSADANTSGAEVFPGAVSFGAVDRLTAPDVDLTAARGLPPVFLALDSTAPAPLTM